MLGQGALAAIAESVQGGRVHFAVPSLVLPFLRSPVSRAYYATLLRLGYVAAEPVSMGVYAVSGAGRCRWSSFPRIHSDDKFARLHFTPEERELVAAATYTVSLPDGVGQITRARMRYSSGNRELARQYPALTRHSSVRHAGVGRQVLARPDRWPAAVVFASLYGIGYVRSFGRW